MPDEVGGLLLVLLVAGASALWRLSRTRRIVITLICVPIGGYSALQMDDRATGFVFLAMPTIVLLIAAVLFAPFKAKRVEALSALASAAMLWLGFVGVLVALGIALRRA